MEETLEGGRGPPRAVEPLEREMRFQEYSQMYMVPYGAILTIHCNLILFILSTVTVTIHIYMNSPTYSSNKLPSSVRQ